MTPYSRRMWEDEETSVVVKYYPGYGSVYCKELLERLGYNRTIDQIQEKAYREGVKRNKGSIPIQRKAILYKLPDCPKCEILKDWLHKQNIRFDQRWFDVKVQTEFIMRNEFGDPPILVIKGVWITSRDLFDGYVLDEQKAHSFINSSRGVAFPSAYETHVYCRKCGVWVWRPLAGERCTRCGSLFRTTPYRDHSPKKDKGKEKKKEKENGE